MCPGAPICILLDLNIAPGKCLARTYGTMVPDTVGILGFVVAIGLLLLGMAVRRI